MGGLPTSRRRKKKRCPECGERQIYHRAKTGDFRCQKCGHIWKEAQENKITEEKA